MHPDSHDAYRRLMDFMQQELGFVEVDWCAWRMADGSLFEVYPCQPAPPMDELHAEMIAQRKGGV